MVNIDDIIAAPSIFINHEFLRTGHVPATTKEILHRDDAITDMVLHTRCMLSNQVPGNLFLMGNTGTGKTMITLRVMEDMKSRAIENKVNALTIYIYCEKLKTNSKVLRHIFTSLENATGATRKNKTNDTGDFFEWFCQLVDVYNGVIILIFDEIDKLTDHDLINSISRIAESKLTSRNVSIIGITNDTTFIKGLDPRTKSVIAQNELIFKPYDGEQLSDILRNRAQIALQKDAFSEEIISLCAAFAAQEHGNARKAINLLRVAGELAEKAGRGEITIEDVYTARDKIEIDRAKEVVHTLPLQSKLVVMALLKLRFEHALHEMTSGDIYSAYSQLCIVADRDVLSARRVSDLIAELDMMGIVQSVVKSKGRYGRTRSIICAVSKNIYEEMQHDEDVGFLISAPIEIESLPRK